MAVKYIWGYSIGEAVRLLSRSLQCSPTLPLNSLYRNRRQTQAYLTFGCNRFNESLTAKLYKQVVLSSVFDPKFVKWLPEKLLDWASDKFSIERRWMSLELDNCQADKLLGSEATAFILRCWLEPGDRPGGKRVWRFCLIQVDAPRKRMGFADLEAVIAYLKQILAEEN